MDKKEIINQEVQKTLDCFNQLGRIPASPYFYTRLQAKMDSRQKEKVNRRTIFSSRAWRPAFIGIIIVLNLTTAILVYLSNGQSKDFTDDTLTVLATEYNLNQDDSDLFTGNK
jgi:hypothetical protein